MRASGGPDVASAAGVSVAQVAQSRNASLTANLNAGSAVTLFTPTAVGVWRISAVEATINTPTGATLPSLTVGWTDAGGVARTYILLATAATSANTTLAVGSVIIYTNGSTAVTVTSASYAAGSGTALAYDLAIVAERI